VVLTLLPVTELVVLMVVHVDSVELLILETVLWVDVVAVLDVIDDVIVAEVLHEVAVAVKDEEVTLWVVLVSGTVVPTLLSVTMLAVVQVDSVMLRD